MTPDEAHDSLEGLLLRTREAFLEDPGYATVIAQRAVEMKTRKERRQLADNGDS